MINHPFRFLLFAVAGWMNRQQQEVIAYLQQENRVLREQLGGKRIRFNDSQRRRLAGRKLLKKWATIADPDTLLRGYRQLIARKYDGSKNRGTGRPHVMETIRKLVVKMAKENRWGYRRIRGAFREILKSPGVKTVKLPAKSPNLNAYAESFVLSIKTECLNKLILLGEGHLRQAVSEYVQHYLLERPHQGLGNELITPANDNAAAMGPVECHERLGGLLRHYRRRAA